jgi:hypothetical protein
VSIVLIPADPNARIRSEELPMPDPVVPTPAPAAPAAVPPGPENRASVNAEIRALAAPLSLPQSWVDAQIDAGATIDAARSAALVEVMRRSQTTPIVTARVIVDHNDPMALRHAMADALAHRMAPTRCQLDERARGYVGHRILDMVGDMAHARGDRVNLRDYDALMERAVGAHSTSDFPLLLSEAANKTLLANYQAAAPTYRQWASRRSFNDFRDHNFLRVGEFPEFKEIAESGEVNYGTLSENREKVRAKELNTGIIVGRRLLINDDLSALSDFSSMIAIRAASDENARAYAILAANPALSDTVAVFHANHGNLAAAGTAITPASIAAAVAALRKQKSLDGLVLNLVPRFLVVGPDKEMEARQLLTVITAAKSSDVNPWSGSLTLVVDANIIGNTWYVMADPAAAPSIVYGYVSGAEGPQIRTEVDFDTRGVKVAAGLDFGCGAIDFRGLYKNTGA